MSLLASLPQRSAILLVGPPLSGQNEFLSSYVKQAIGSSDPMLVITTDKQPEDFISTFISGVDVKPYEEAKKIRFLDCYSKQVEDGIKNTPTIKRISSPIALNEISIGLSEIERDFVNLNKTHRVVVNSLSTMLMYSNPNMIGRFTQVIIGKIKKASGSCVFLIEEGMHDQNVLVTLEHLMDVVVFIKKEQDKTMVKAQGISGFSDWSELEGGTVGN